MGQTDGTAGDEGKEKEDAETIFEGPKEEDRPEDHWWRVRVVFDTEETSILQFQLNHVLGLRPPGAVWFDGFSLQRVKENETKSPPGKVEVEMMPKGFKLSGN